MTSSGYAYNVNNEILLGEEAVHQGNVLNDGLSDEHIGSIAYGQML